jgi:hypothetical protein
VSEQQVHDITVTLADLSQHDTGGGTRSVVVNITIDSSLPRDRQRASVIHEILGVYLGIVVNREDIEEMAEAVVDGLNQLEEAPN